MPRFSVGVNYWPRTSATAMWRRFDPGEIAEDFARISALGLDTVRIFLRWDDFQPAAGELDATMAARLGAVADLAAVHGLRLMVTLFCGAMHGQLLLPRWARDADLYSGPLLEAQLFFAGAVAERLRDHPALHAWDIGHRFSDVREPPRGKVSTGEHSTEPSAAPRVAEWARRLAGALHEHSAAAVTAGTAEADLLRDRNFRFGSLCAPFAFASMQGGPVTSLFARNRNDPEAVPFLASVSAAFSYKPVLVSGFGNPTCPPGKFSAFERFAAPGEPPNFAIADDDTAFATYPCLTEAENAAFCTATLERLHADGRLGAYWWCWADYAETVDGATPAPLAAHERACGIVRADGSDKPVAAALAAFAAQRREVRPASEMPMISSAYYYRTLPTSARTLYEAFLDFVSERRAAEA